MSGSSFAGFENKYVGVFYSQKEEKPITHPALFKTKADCEKDMKFLAQAAFDKMKIKREYTCSEVVAAQ